MGQNLTHKIIAAHLASGEMVPGQEISIEIDQTLTQDTTGTMVWLEFEAMGLPRVSCRCQAGSYLRVSQSPIGRQSSLLR